MSQIADLHHSAMDLADQALLARREGNPVQARELLRQAFVQEAAAAQILRDRLDAEPSRSVLYRSAAALAIECEEFREAERLVATAIMGNPPTALADELRELLDRLNFRRHLQLRGVELEPYQVQVTIAGQSVGEGTVRSDTVVEFLQTIQRMFYRTMARLAGRSYQDSAGYGRSVQDSQLYVSAPRLGSFAVSLSVGRPEQAVLPGFEYTAVIDELLTCIQLVETENDAALAERIGDPTYLRNFVGLAKKLAPDGENVRLVGFTTVRDGVEYQVQLTRRQDEISLPIRQEANQPLVDEISLLIGQLRYADALHSQNEIRLVDEAGKTYQIVVPEGMMSDIVSPLWNQSVRVMVRRINNTGKLQLIDITQA